MIPLASSAQSCVVLVVVYGSSSALVLASVLLLGRHPVRRSSLVVCALAERRYTVPVAAHSQAAARCYCMAARHASYAAADGMILIRTHVMPPVL